MTYLEIFVVVVDVALFAAGLILAGSVIFFANKDKTDTTLMMVIVAIFSIPLDMRVVAYILSLFKLPHASRYAVELRFAPYVLVMLGISLYLGITTIMGNVRAKARKRRNEALKKVYPESSVVPE